MAASRAATARAPAGGTVTLTINPDTGYRLKAGTLKFNGTAIEGDSFTMPAEDVTVTAEFELIPNNPPVIEGPGTAAMPYRGSMILRANQAVTFNTGSRYVRLEQLDEKTVKVTSTWRFFCKSGKVAIMATTGDGDSAAVTVSIKPTFWQYIVIILLFGWIWY